MTTNLFVFICCKFLKMSGLLSLSGTKATNDLKVNVVNTSNINLLKSPPTSKHTDKKSGEEIREEEEFKKPVFATYDDTQEDNPYANISTDDIMQLKNENEALKIIINILQNNPFYVNKFIVADDVKLMELVKLLTCADDVQMDAEDFAQGCITKNKYRKVNSIYVIKDGQTKNLKYDYPGVMKELTELCVSVKFVW